MTWCTACRCPVTHWLKLLNSSLLCSDSNEFILCSCVATQDCVTFLLGVNSNKVFLHMHTPNLKVDEVKQLFCYASSRLSNSRIQSRSPWPPRPYDPPAHGGISSGFSFPPCSALCSADAWFLSSVWRCECGSQKADPNPQQDQGPLPVCCLCRFAPWSVFSVRGETFSITREGTWMVALLMRLHVG